MFSVGEEFRICDEMAQTSDTTSTRNSRKINCAGFKFSAEPYSRLLKLDNEQANKEQTYHFECEKD